METWTTPLASAGEDVAKTALVHQREARRRHSLSHRLPNAGQLQQIYLAALRTVECRAVLFILFINISVTVIY